MDRSIPAPAGEPLERQPLPFQSRVYPRACGGTSGRIKVISRVYGLSPRLRGNRGVPDQHGVVVRSIPAPAGEPMSPLISISSACGLSPRLRGNQYPAD